MIDDEEVYAYLEHFGVKGMHWGIRNDKEKKARREANAKKFDDKAKKYQRQLDQLKPGKFKPGITKKRNQALEDAKRKREGKLSSGQRKVVIGASAAAAILLAVGAYNTVQSGNGRRLVAKGKDFITKNDVPFKKNPLLARPNLDVDQLHTLVVKPINPDYGALGTKMNCRRATYAYELRRRGYDVAATRTSNGRGQDITGNINVLNPGINLVPPGGTGILKRLFSESHKGPDAPKPVTDLVKSKNMSLGAFLFPKEAVHNGGVIRALSGYPDGARGELAVQWSSGGLHSVAWEKIKGQVVVFDNQTGKRYQGADLSGLMKQLNQAGITRLDDKPLNIDFLRRWVKNASGKMPPVSESPQVFNANTLRLLENLKNA